MGVRAGMHRLAMALMLLPNPLDCMNTAEFRPVGVGPHRHADGLLLPRGRNQVKVGVVVYQGGNPVNGNVGHVCHQGCVPFLQ